MANKARFCRRSGRGVQPRPCFGSDQSMTTDDSHDKESNDEIAPSKSQYTDEDLLRYIERVAEEVDGTPTLSDMDAFAPCSHSLYNKRFDSWGAALQQAGFEPNVRFDITKEELIEALQEFAEECGRTPSSDMMTDDGPFGANTYLRYFGSWNEALQEAGLTVELPRDIDREDLTEEVRRLADELDRTPTQRDMSEHGAYTIDPYIDRWGTWNELLEDLGYEENHREDITDEELIEYLEELGDELGFPPTYEGFQDYGDYAAATYQRRFGSWKNAIEKAGFDPEHHLRIRIDERDGKYYGPNWPEQRQKARDRDGQECQDCGMTRQEHFREYGCNLPVHHRRRFASFAPFESIEDYEEANALSNLITLCHKCHKKWEYLPVQPPSRSE